MPAGTRKESVESRGTTARNDGLHSVNGTGLSDGGISSSQDLSFGTGGTGGTGETTFGKTSWFAPVDSSPSPDVIPFGECKDGVCPVPWLKVPDVTIEAIPEIKPDVVNHPPHYTDGGIECIEAIEAELTSEEWRGYLKGNIAKYIWREKRKGGTESLKKAQWYLDRLIAFDEAQNG